jgi:molecular chaperone DnaK (HSP70)
MSTYGIDLGTTYSCIAKLDQNGNPEVIENFAEGTSTLASAVFFEEGSSNVLCGESAKDYIETSPERLIQFAKRVIGKSEQFFIDNPEEKYKFGSNATITPNGLTWNIDGKEYTPIEISAIILKKLKKMAEDQVGPVKDVIITCPAYFGFAEREATRTAGELAGMNVMDLIDEPTAAAVSYCYREFQENQTVAVYDLGGGTFDISILGMSVVKGQNGEDRNQVKQLASAGNDYLGGKDWDEILYSILLDKCAQEVGMDAGDFDADTRQRIRGKVETTKRTLSMKDSHKVKVKLDDGPISVTVTREEFEEATSHLLAKTMDLMEKALQDAGNVNIDKVLLVGGSTYMPMVKNAVEARFPGIVKVEDPAGAVAKGAAVYASIIVDSTVIPDPDDVDRTNPTDADTETEKPFVKEGWVSTQTDGEKGPIVPQSPRSFGPGVFIDNEYTVDNLIIKGAELPATSTKVYRTMVDNQSCVMLSVFESMTLEKRIRPCQDPEGNPQDTNPEYLMQALGQLVLDLSPNTPAGTEIEVTFFIDAGGIHVTAKNLVTGESNSAEIKYATSMTSEEKEIGKERINSLSLED